jgi:hypothetical protein
MATTLFHLVPYLVTGRSEQKGSILLGGGDGGDPATVATEHASELKLFSHFDLQKEKIVLQAKRPPGHKNKAPKNSPRKFAAVGFCVQNEVISGHAQNVDTTHCTVRTAKSSRIL